MTTLGSTSTRLRPVPAAASVQSSVVATAARLTIRRLNNALPNNAFGVAIGRGIVAGFMAALGPPIPGTTVTPVRDGAVRGEWVQAPGVERADGAIYYLHGSAYVICSPRTHRGLASRLSAKTGLPVFVIDYRLAPEHRFPAAADDIAAGYNWLLNRGFDAAELVIGGDSAGGHLAMDLLIENHRSGTPQPAGVVLFSPLLDLTLGLAAEQERTQSDPLMSAKAAGRVVGLYTAGQPDEHPRLKLGFPCGIPLPPIFVQVSSGEMLSGDARLLRHLIDAAGGACELEVWPGQLHVFQALPRALPEAAWALARAASFVVEVLADSAPHRKASGCSDSSVGSPRTPTPRKPSSPVPAAESVAPSRSNWPLAAAK